MTSCDGAASGSLGGSETDDVAGNGFSRADEFPAAIRGHLRDLHLSLRDARP